MKTIILLILVSIANTSSQKEAGTETSKQNIQLSMKECQPLSTKQTVEATKYKDNMEMPNNWNIKVIEW